LDLGPDLTFLNYQILGGRKIDLHRIARSVQLELGILGTCSPGLYQDTRGMHENPEKAGGPILQTYMAAAITECRALIGAVAKAETDSLIQHRVSF